MKFIGSTIQGCLVVPVLHVIGSRPPPLQSVRGFDICFRLAYKPAYIHTRSICGGKFQLVHNITPSKPLIQYSYL